MNQLDIFVAGLCSVMTMNLFIDSCGDCGKVLVGCHNREMSWDGYHREAVDRN